MNEIAERVLYRFFVRAAMSDDKLNEILLKIRKGATSSLNWKQIGEVLAALDPGWKLEKIVGAAKLYGYQGNEDAPERFVGYTEGDAEAKHREMEQHVVSTLPSSPKAGTLYVKDLTPVILDERYGKSWSFTCLVWMGAEGWRITTPDGKTRDELPGRFDLGELQHGFRTRSRSKLAIWDAVKWLNLETDWLAQINTKLGMDAHEPAAPRTREGTGTCGVCFQNIKARPEMVLHGYKRPGTGQVHGNCFGMKYLPFEVSVKATKEYLEKSLKPQLKQEEFYLKSLEDGKITTLMTYGHQTVTSEDPKWDRMLKDEIEDAKRRVQSTKAYVEAYEKLVQHWKERPLPQEGGRHIDWFHEGQKP